MHFCPRYMGYCPTLLCGCLTLICTYQLTHSHTQTHVEILQIPPPVEGLPPFFPVSLCQKKNVPWHFQGNKNVRVNIYKQMHEIFRKAAIWKEGLHIKAKGTTGEEFLSLSAILTQPSSKDQIPVMNILHRPVVTFSRNLQEGWMNSLLQIYCLFKDIVRIRLSMMDKVQEQRNVEC